jgi:tetratricopeptide (TPR) repeat protein
LTSAQAAEHGYRVPLDYPAARAARVIIVVGFVSALTLSLARTAVAEEPAAPPVVTETQALTLFREGRALLESHDYAGAVAKLEESFRLDPGGGTRLNLALAYELAGRTASAWTSFQDALAMAKRDARADRADEAEAHLRALEPRLSRLRIVVPAPARTPGLQVLRDGVMLGEASWGVDVPVDPGLHRVDARAPGRRPWVAQVAVNDSGDRKEITLGALEEVAAAPAAAPRAGPPLRSIGWIALSAGAVGLATAAATGAAANAKNPNCPGGLCPASEQGRVDTYNSLRTASTISFWAGGGLVAAGLTMLLLVPARHEDGAAVVLAPRFVGFAAHF